MDEGQGSVGHVLVQWHPTLKGSFGKHPGGKHEVVLPDGHKRGHRRKEPWCVLVIGVKHHNHIRSEFQCFTVTGLLVCSVSFVLAMHYCPYVQGFRDFHGPVGACVIHEYHFIDELVGYLLVSHAQEFLCVIGGHYDNDFLSVYHPCLFYHTFL